MYYPQHQQPMLQVPQQQPYYPPPPPPPNPHVQDPLDAMASKPHGGLGRDVLDHANYDSALLKKIPGTTVFFPPWQMKLEVAIQLLVLFNSITTIMIIIAQFIDRVPNEQTIDFGRSNYNAMKWFLIIIPLTCFLMLVLMVNNYYSRATFYFYLQRGAIIDFPESSSPKYIFTHLVPWIFIIVFVFFFILVVYTMSKFDASAGQIIIVCSNLVIGVASAWYRQQSIEDKFITISQFLQKFPDSQGDYNNMDGHSLDMASKAMNDLTLLKTEHPSWGNTMRHRWWKEKNWTVGWMIGINILIFVAVAALAGIGMGFYYMSVREDEKRRWRIEVAPCVRSCQAGMLTKDENQSVAGTGGAVGSVSGDWVEKSCTFCICLCVRRLYVRHTIDNLCQDGLEAAAGNDAEFNSDLRCVEAENTNCPDKNCCPNTETCKKEYEWYDPEDTV